MKKIVLPYYKGRPSVTLKLRNRKNEVRFFNALIDSGADFAIFPIKAAFSLGIDVKHLQKVPVEAADGHYFDTYHTTIQAEFDNILFPLPIGFVAHPDVTQAVGRAGFFDTFKVEFDERKKLVTLKAYS